MRECHEMTERDALPLLLRGRLAPSEAARVRAHVATCAACAEELALLERSAKLFDMATPRVDVAAIVAKLPAAPQRPALRVDRGGARGPFVPRYAWAAAASLTLVATLSFAALKGRVFDGTSGATVAPDTATPVPSVPPVVPVVPVAPAAQVPAALVTGAELGELGSSELEALLAELDEIEATIAAEPVSMQRAVMDAPEGR